MSVLAIVQARMGSTRLPGKVLLPLAGQPMLAHIVRRLEKVDAIGRVVVATTNARADDPLARFCHEAGIDAYRHDGDPRDVLSRYYEAALAARASNFSSIVRVTADCPLVDPELVAEVIAARTDELDHTHAAVAPWWERAWSTTLTDPLLPHHLYPDGYDVECFTLAMLRLQWATETRAAEREHVTGYVYAGRARTGAVYHSLSLDPTMGPWPWPNVKLSVDTQDDFDRLAAIYAACPYPTRDTVHAYLTAAR